MKNQRLYCLSKNRKIKIGILLVIFSVMPNIFLGLVIHDSSIWNVVLGFGWFNLVWLLFFQAGISFFLIKKLPILILNEKELYYNELYMPLGRGDGLFFILFPYWYKTLTSKLSYSEIKSFELKNKNFFEPQRIVFHLKVEQPILKLGVFNEIEIKEIYEYLKLKIK